MSKHICSPFKLKINKWCPLKITDVTLLNTTLLNKSYKQKRQLFDNIYFSKNAYSHLTISNIAIGYKINPQTNRICDDVLELHNNFKNSKYHIIPSSIKLISYDNNMTIPRILSEKHIEYYKNMIEYCNLHNISLNNVYFQFHRSNGSFDYLYSILPLLIENNITNFNLSTIEEIDSSDNMNNVLTYTELNNILRYNI